MRGLKPALRPNPVRVRRVASFTDAWIETATNWSADIPASLSHLLQMRGLKPCLTACKRNSMRVASFTDAWIETLLTA